MQRGPKLKNPNSKKLAGTYREAIDGGTAPIVQLVEDTPVAPLWLSEGAKDVWATDLARVVKCGATEVDSNMFGLYCDTMATFIADQKSGVPSNAAFRSELRKQMEMLGIAGPKARLARLSDTTSPAKANLASPALTGTPTAPTPTAGTNNTQLATTNFVAANYAPITSPNLQGTPLAPTAAAGTNNTQLATTAFVQATVPAVASYAYPRRTRSTCRRSTRLTA